MLKIKTLSTGIANNHDIYRKGNTLFRSYLIDIEKDIKHYLKGLTDFDSSVLKDDKVLAFLRSKILNFILKFKKLKILKKNISRSIISN